MQQGLILKYNTLEDWPDYLKANPYSSTCQLVTKNGKVKLNIFILAAICPFLEQLLSTLPPFIESCIILPDIEWTEISLFLESFLNKKENLTLTKSLAEIFGINLKNFTEVSNGIQADTKENILGVLHNDDLIYINEEEESDQNHVKEDEIWKGMDIAYDATNENIEEYKTNINDLNTMPKGIKIFEKQPYTKFGKIFPQNHIRNDFAWKCYICEEIIKERNIITSHKVSCERKVKTWKRSLKEAMDKNEEQLSKAICHLVYEKLSVDVTNLKSTDTIRSELNKMLKVQGFGRNTRKKYGQGVPPLGWPEEINWESFKGSSNTKSLRNVDLVRIISSMLIYAGFDPHTHVTNEVMAAKAAVAEIENSDSLEEQANDDNQGMDNQDEFPPFCKFLG